MTRNLAQMFNLNPVADLPADDSPADDVEQDPAATQRSVGPTATVPGSGGDNLDTTRLEDELSLPAPLGAGGGDTEEAAAPAAGEATRGRTRKKAQARPRTAPRKSPGRVDVVALPAPADASEVAEHVPPAGDRAASDSSPGGKQQIMVYLPDEVVESFKQQARRLQVTYAQLMLLSVEQTFEDELPALFAGRAGTGSRLFSTGYIPRNQHTTPKTAVNLHLRIGDLEVIDRLWRGTAGCRSRNDYLSTAARAYLSKAAQT